MWLIWVSAVKQPGWDLRCCHLKMFSFFFWQKKRRYFVNWNSYGLYYSSKFMIGLILRSSSEQEQNWEPRAETPGPQEGLPVCVAHKLAPYQQVLWNQPGVCQSSCDVITVLFQWRFSEGLSLLCGVLVVCGHRLQNFYKSCIWWGDCCFGWAGISWGSVDFLRNIFYWKCSWLQCCICFCCTAKWFSDIYR